MPASTCLREDQAGEVMTWLSAEMQRRGDRLSRIRRRRRSPRRRLPKRKLEMLALLARRPAAKARVKRTTSAAMPTVRMPTATTRHAQKSRLRTRVASCRKTYSRSRKVARAKHKKSRETRSGNVRGRQLCNATRRPQPQPQDRENDSWRTMRRAHTWPRKYLKVRPVRGRVHLEPSLAPRLLIIGYRR